MAVKIMCTSPLGIILFETQIFPDARGEFTELYQEEKFRELGIDTKFIQDNLSISKKGTLRGFHFQKNQPQAKLIFPIGGMIYDVIVDVRRDSNTYGKSEGFVLKKGDGLFVPKGFAHGFLTLTDATILYKCDEFYDPSDEGGIIWNDEDLKIDWQKLFDEYGIDEPILSQKDANLPAFSSLKID